MLWAPLTTVNTVRKSAKNPVDILKLVIETPASTYALNADASEFVLDDGLDEEADHDVMVFEKQRTEQAE